ncbi:hypothetical protein [Yinghuangia soli]|uniref:Uncharacterized protein n=1 Tax=Yinghuangia soli TaxID=2908204 RepID=A0AA41Q4F3_9ACTN|nr:hypothetical protein [Yinghuangia soli]MCF2531363.1 hypothetical protein [Yinghuangia soli]
MNTDRTTPSARDGFEAELAGSMRDFADRRTPRAFDPEAIRATVRGRRNRRYTAVAAAAAVAVLAGGTVVALAPGDAGEKAGVTVQPTASASDSPAPQASAPTAEPTGPRTGTGTPNGTRTGAQTGQNAGNPDSSGHGQFLATLRRLYTTAETDASGRTTYQPAPAQSLFAPGKEATELPRAHCGTAGVNGALIPQIGVLDSSGDGRFIAIVRLYKGRALQDKEARVTVDAAGLITSITCTPRPVNPKVVAEGLAFTMAYGGIVSASRPATQAEITRIITEAGPEAPATLAGLTCQSTQPKRWVLDSPASGTTVNGWTVTFDGGAAPFTVGEDATRTPSSLKPDCRP